MALPQTQHEAPTEDALSAAQQRLNAALELLEAKFTGLASVKNENASLAKLLAQTKDAHAALTKKTSAALGQLDALIAQVEKA